MTQTRRKEIIDILETRPMTAKQLADYFKLSVTDILEDLKHISQTLKPVHKKIAEQLPVCNFCGFIFKKREKLSRPSKCPKCRSEDITEPVFSIK